MYPEVLKYQQPVLEPSTQCLGSFYNCVRCVQKFVVRLSFWVTVFQIKKINIRNVSNYLLQ